MSVCALCGHPTFGAEGICAYHSASHGEDWALGNRVMCDFLHRGIIMPEPPDSARRRLDALFDGWELEPALSGSAHSSN